MDDDDTYLFDLQGYLVIPDALSPQTVRSLNEVLDEAIADEAAPDMRTHRFGDLLARRGFRDLIDNEAVFRVLHDVLGRGFRLDHTYADVIRQGEGPIGTTLHGGPLPYRSAEYYLARNGEIRSGLVAVAYNLHDVGPEDGGFACVPGSHKSAFPFPDAWRHLATRHPCVRPITGPAGTAVVFTEAMVHGTMPWRGEQERRTAFYKYSPAAVSYDSRYYDPSDYPDLTPRQQEMLRPPYWR